MSNKPARNDALRDRLSRSREINISVIGRKSGRTISNPVWFVLDEDNLYLLPVQGSDTQWYQNVLKNPSIRIEAGKAGAEVRVVTITDATQVSSVVYKIPRQVWGQRREEVLFKVRRCCSRSDAVMADRLLKPIDALSTAHGPFSGSKKITCASHLWRFRFPRT